MHGKVSANQIDNTNQKQNSTQTTATLNTESSADNNNNVNNTNALTSNDNANTSGNALTTNDSAQVNDSNATTNNSTVSDSNDNQENNYNENDHGNYAYLDSVSLSDDGSVNVSGWNTTNDSKNKPDHYIIAYDNTTKTEIGRVKVENPITRNDIQRTYNLYGANKSGFNVTFKLPADSLANADSISFISRYTSSLDGNSNYTDFWYAPITFDKNNRAWLDSVAIKDGQLQVSGWNATNQAANKPIHTIIVYDRTTNQVVGSQIVENIARPDVAKRYQNIINADKSGFFASFDLNHLNLNHELQIISRYGTKADGSGSNADYYFTPITSGNYTNQGNLDSFDISDSKTLKVTGWQADDISKLESNRFLILFDNTTNRQVAVTKAETVSRPDVANVYKSLSTANQSGFVGSFDLSNISLNIGHSYSIVSRYSTSDQSNGGYGQYTDYWFKPVTLDQKANNIESISMQNDGLHISGWMVSDYSKGRSNAYIIVLNNGKEVARQKITLTDRPDVAKAYSSVYGSEQSGFNTIINFDPALITGNMQVIMRFAASEGGNSDFDDQYTQSYASNVGAFDNITVDDTGIMVAGWHASDQSATRPYQYLIFLDANTGKEITRERVWDINRVRNDVSASYPTVLNSGNSGFQLWFKIPSELDHHTVKIINRLTDDVNGNGNYVDIYSDPVSIHNNRWAWPFPAVGEGHFMGAQLFGVNPGGEFRQNGFHDGLDFGAYDHPGTNVQAIHSGTIVGVGYTAGLDWYVLEDTGEYLIVYQEAFSNRGNINVTPGQKIEVGDVIGRRDTSHVHIGITRQHNFNIALAKSFTNDGTWLNPLEIIRNGLNG